MSDDRLPALFETNGVVPRETTAFEDFWEHYPRKVGKTGRGGAEGAWRAAIKRCDAATILAGLLGWVRYWQRTSTETRFIPYPATWLNQSRWADVPTVADSQGAWSKALAAARTRDGLR